MQGMGLCLSDDLEGRGEPACYTAQLIEILTEMLLHLLKSPQNRKIYCKYSEPDVTRNGLLCGTHPGHEWEKEKSLV